jgi:hypothetical protein
VTAGERLHGKIAAAFREYEAEMVERSTPKVLASRLSCAELHCPAMIEPAFHARRKDIAVRHPRRTE